MRVWRNWAKRNAASGGRYRHCAEVKKQGAMRRAPSEQGDYISEGSALVLGDVASAFGERFSEQKEAPQSKFIGAPSRNKFW